MKLIKFLIVVLFCSIFISALFVSNDIDIDNTTNNNIVDVIDGFENDIENNNVVDDGVYINEEESVIVDDKDSPINNAVVDIGNFVTKIVRKVFEVIAGVVSKFVN